MQIVTGARAHEGGSHPGGALLKKDLVAVMLSTFKRLPKSSTTNPRALARPLPVRLVQVISTSAQGSVPGSDTNSGCQVFNPTRRFIVMFSDKPTNEADRYTISYSTYLSTRKVSQLYLVSRNKLSQGRACGRVTPKNKKILPEPSLGDR